MIDKIHEYIADYNKLHNVHNLFIREGHSKSSYTMTLMNLSHSLCVDVELDIEHMSMVNLPLHNILDTHVKHMTDMIRKYARGN